MPSDLPSPPPSPATRPHRFLATRHISRPVRNSLTRCAIKHVCSVFLSLFFIAVLLLLVLWLELRPHRPRFHLSSFSATGLSAPGNGLVFTLDVAIRNPNREIAIYYGPMSASVYYRDDRVGSSGMRVRAIRLATQEHNGGERGGGWCGSASFSRGNRQRGVKGERGVPARADFDNPIQCVHIGYTPAPPARELRLGVSIR